MPSCDDAERVGEIVAQRMTRFGAQPSDVARRVVARQRREIHQRDRAEQPRGLPFLLDGAARGDGRRAALDGAPIDANRPHDVEVERHSGIAFDVVVWKRARRCDERRAARAIARRRTPRCRGIDSRFGFAVMEPPVRHGIGRKSAAPVVAMYAFAHAVTRAGRRAGTNRVSKGLHRLGGL